MTEKSSQTNEKFIKHITLSDTLLLAFVPFLAYLFTYVYQAGYLQAFSLPLQFASVTITDVFNIGSKILGVFAIVFGLINFFSSFLLPRGKLPYSLRKRLSQLLPFFLMIFPALFLFDWGTTSTIALFFFLFAFFIMFFPPLVTRKYKGTYLQKMEMTDNEVKDSNPWEGNLLDRTANFIGHNAFVAIVYFLLSIYITYYAGVTAAQKQEIFYIANTSPETVVLFMTNDKMVTAPFDINTKMVTPEYLVINISDSQDLKLRLSKIGRLKLDTTSMIPLTIPTPTLLPTQTPTISPLATSTKAP